MQTIVTIKLNTEFTDANLETAKAFLRAEAFPQFYTNEEFESLEFHGLQLIEEHLIIRDGYGSSQSVRAEGKNEKYDELRYDILENGFRLYEKPIFLRPCPDHPGKFLLVDGRTKDKILHEKKVKNRICAVIDIDESEADVFGNRTNAGEDRPPAGLLKEIDILSLAQRMIDQGTLELEVEAISNFIDKVCGNKGKFSPQRRTALTYQIFHQNNAIQTSKLLPVAWSNVSEVNTWLKAHNYIETDKVVYLPYAASSPVKAVFAAAALAQQKPNKEVRLVAYVSKLNGRDLQKCYLEAVLKFKNNWYYYMEMLGSVYYSGKSSNEDRVKLYGYVPSNIETVCDNMEKLIVIGKTDQNIDDSFLTNQSLNSYFDIGEEDL